MLALRTYLWNSGLSLHRRLSNATDKIVIRQRTLYTLMNERLYTRCTTVPATMLASRGESLAPVCAQPRLLRDGGEAHVLRAIGRRKNSVERSDRFSLTSSWRSVTSADLRDAFDSYLNIELQTLPVCCAVRISLNKTDCLARRASYFWSRASNCFYFCRRDSTR